MAGAPIVSPPRIIRFPPFELDVRAAELRKHGIKVRLHDQPFRILLALLNRPGDVVLREEIRKVLWPNDTVVEFDGSINAAIQRLREALGDSADNPRYVETLARRGYRFIGAVKPPEARPPDEAFAQQAPALVDPNDLSGQTVSRFRVIGKLGSGGMGVVYRAEDLKLGRQVALKFLPVPASEAPQELLDRFRREARAASALNHPNICTIHGIEEFAGQPAIVMELAEGETLAQRLAKAPLAWKEALPLAMQIAGALDAAHRKGIVHRDLKPANIMLTKSGAKVLDFGLAKMEPPGPKGTPAGEAGVAEVSQPGMVMGTFQYMSPEQVQGKDADARSDIFSFGLVLYELLAGERAFTGDSPASVMAAILDQPAPSLPSAAPPELEWLLHRCLVKDPDDRWQTARDLRAELERIAAAPAGTTLQARSQRSYWPAVAGFCILLAAALTLVWRSHPAPEARAVEFEIVAPLNSAFRNYQRAVAVSPDGRWIVFRAQSSGARRATLWLRPLDSPIARPLAGTENGDTPFWSPDSKSLAFYAGGKLKRIEIAGGPTVTLCDVLGEYSGSWSSEGVILFASGRNLIRILASGGKPAIVTETDPSRNESRHLFPQFLPDGKHFLFLIKSADPNTRGVYVGSLDHPRERRRLLASSYKAIYTAPRNGHPGSLLFLRDLALMAQTFDAGSLRLIGEPVAIMEDVGVNRFDNAAFWASDTGVLAYRAGSNNSRLVWMSREGRRLEEVEPGDRYDALALSPDDQRVALCRADTNNISDIWIYRFARKAMTRLTYGSGPVDSPVWSPDGRQIAFSSGRTGTFQIYRMNADGSGREEKLTDGPDEKYPSGWSRDGKYLLYLDGAQVREISSPPKAYDVWLLPLEGDRKPVPLLQAPFDEELATFSPDGKWIAYMSTESAPPWNVYVRAFSGPSLGPGGKVQISTDGGWPHWRGDGKEIFYHRFTDHPELMAARIRVGNGGIQSESPVELFPFGGNASVTAHTWDVTADGQRLLISELVGLSSVANRLNVVVNWQARLSR
ncbi:MAG: protein kinase [Candidatus Solibacter sp.]|jgi:Tol biopolymer transport system component/DNA-binding winged helix-turn-helix (wHTH) protein